MKNLYKIFFLLAFVGLFINVCAFAQTPYPRDIETAIEQGLHLRIANDGQQVVFNEIKTATNQVNRNAVKTYMLFYNAQKKIPEEVIDLYSSLEDNVRNIARLNAMDKSVYVQIAGAVQMPTLQRNQKIIKDNIFKICTSSGIFCDPYGDDIAPILPSTKANNSRQQSTTDDPKTPRLSSPKRRGTKISEARHGFNKVCYYNALGSTYAYNTSSTKICPLTMEF